jgi:hypothetical protein
MRHSYLSNSYTVRSTSDLPGHVDDSHLSREERIARAFPIRGEVRSPVDAAPSNPPHSPADLARAIGETLRRHHERLRNDPGYRKRHGMFQRGVWSQNGNW